MREPLYISTRGESRPLPFEEVLLKGLAPDGGLYLPDFSDDEMEKLVDPAELRGKNYAETAYRIILPFIKGSPHISDRDLAEMCDQVYSGAIFDHAAIAPLKQLDNNLWGLELFHGPTFAFKDYALQLVGKMFDHVLKQKKERLTIIGATSGDTGSAAIRAVSKAENIRIFMLHPFKRVSDMQRKQMVTVTDKNVHNLAVKGNFDDCQNIVKSLFGDAELNQNVNLGAVNSINFARILAQIVYYFYAGINLAADQRAVDIVVPTGNFGNIFAAFLAKKMGLKINRLLIASNVNDILPRFIASGTMEKKDGVASLSPSMDIQISSNFERLLYYAADRNTSTVNRLMKQFKETGIFTADDKIMENIRQTFSAISIDDDETLGSIRKTYDDCKEITDPHSAVAIAAARKHLETSALPAIAIMTAHPAKFTATVKKAIDIEPPIPDDLKRLETLSEKYDIVENDILAVKNCIMKNKQSE